MNITVQKHSMDFLKSPPSQIILWGAGERGKHCYGWLKKHGLHERVVAFLDSDAKKTGETLFLLPIITPERLKEHAEASIVFCSGIFLHEMKSHMENYGFENILFFFEERRPFIQENSCVLSEEAIRAVYQNDPITSLEIESCLFLRSKTENGAILPYEDASLFPSFIDYWESPECTLDVFERISLVDAGAYTGDTIEYLQRRYGTKIEKILAFEPEKKAYAELVETISRLGLEKVASLYRCGLSSNDNAGKTSFMTYSNDEFEFDACRLDGVEIDPKGKLCIKMDIEGAELQALEGAKNTIQKYKPELAICVYHRYGDILEIPRYIKQICSDYRCILRSGSHMECYASVERF